MALSGGGAKGAYQVGMLRAFVELGGQIDSVAGASIGALNGAVIASSGQLDEAVKRLEALWTGDLPHALYIFSNALARGLSGGVWSASPLRKFISENMDLAALDVGLPLYVSIYRSSGRGDVGKLALAELGLDNTRPSEFLCVQELTSNERIECLMASTAIPLLFAPRTIQGSTYADGGQGGWWTRQGNVPVEPLVREGCDAVVVMHAEDGSPWNRTEHPNTTLVEMRPTHTPSKSPFTDMLTTDSKVISSWIQQGYSDGKRTLGRIVSAVESRNELRRSSEARLAAQQRVVESEGEMEHEEGRLASVLADIMRT